MRVFDVMAGIINFKIRRRFVLIFSLIALDVMCSEIENDVLTLQDDFEMEASDRRRPTNGQEKEILLLDALGRRKGPYQSQYTSSQEDDSIMDLLGKSKYSLNTIVCVK